VKKYDILMLSVSFSSGAGAALSVEWVDYGLDDRGSIIGRFNEGILFTASRPILRPTQPPIQWVPEALSLGIKWPGREADHSTPSTSEVKNAWSYTSTPPVHLHAVVLS